MTNNKFNYIKQLLDHGHYVRVELDKNKHRTLDSIMLIFDDGMERLLDYNGEFWKEEDFESNYNVITKITPIPRPIKLLEVGQKVVVLDTREIEHFLSDYKSPQYPLRVGMVLTIKEWKRGANAYSFENHGAWLSPNSVAPIQEQSSKVDEILKDLSDEENDEIEFKIAFDL